MAIVNPQEDKYYNVAFTQIISVEGGLSMDRSDPGNWTGNKVGVGILKGTKYGIAAGSFPNEDIKNLTIQRAKELYYKHYWLECKCNYIMNLRLAIWVFDAGVNQGVGIAKRMLQRALGVEDDGVIGPATLDALQRMKIDILIPYFLTQRQLRYVEVGGYDRYGKGWFNRLNLMAERMKGLD